MPLRSRPSQPITTDSELEGADWLVPSPAARGEAHALELRRASPLAGWWRIDSLGAHGPYPDQLLARARAR